MGPEGGQLVLHDSHLGGGELQLAQPHLVARLQVEDLVLLALQQGLEGEDELQVGGGGDVVAAPPLLIEPAECTGWSIIDKHVKL